MAADDPYQILGVARTATDGEIRDAYRKLAKRHHPDLNPGDKAAEERFKRISAAHGLLSDAEQRARFDRGEIDGAGQDRAPRHAHSGPSDGRGRRPGGARGGQMDPEDLSDIFSEFFKNGGGRPGMGAGMGAGAGPDTGRDRQYVLNVSFVDAVTGATPRLSLPDGRTLDVRVPPGIEEGQTLRLKGQGDPARAGRPAGDALIEIHIEPHPVFRRDGRDIHAEVPVTVAEAVSGGRIEVPTAFGEVTMAIPKHAETGTRLRLRGKGIPAQGGKPAGDQYVTLKLVLGPVDDAMDTFFRDHPQSYNPRRDPPERR